MSLQDFASSRSLDLYWDPFAREALITNAKTSVELSSQRNFITVNYETKLQSKALSFENGTWMLSEDSLLLLEDIFPRTVLPERQISAIFIDAGHGGKDSGASRTHGSGDEAFTLNEKDINLTVSLKLTNLLEQAFPHIDIIQSRTEDIYFELGRKNRYGQCTLGRV
jgi:N-acetylmuramoyl-L-alanine amidase